jgi:hypothetical protein
VRFWIDTGTVHLSVDGWRIKTVPSRLSAVDIADFDALDARPQDRNPGLEGLERGEQRRDHCDDRRWDHPRMQDQQVSNLCRSSDGAKCQSQGPIGHSHKGKALRLRGAGGAARAFT